MARSLEEWRMSAHGFGRLTRRQVEPGRLSHLEAEVQLGTNHLAKLAKLANRQNSDCQAQCECIKPPTCPRQGASDGCTAGP